MCELKQIESAYFKVYFKCIKFGYVADPLPIYTQLKLINANNVMLKGVHQFTT